MRILIEKKSGKPFPPPFNGLGKTAIAVDVIEHPFIKDRKAMAFVLENGSIVEVNKCNIIDEVK